MKEKVIKFIKELVIYVIVLVVLQFVSNTIGWTDTSILQDTIGLTLCWIVGKLVIMFIESRRNKKNQ